MSNNLVVLQALLERRVDINQSTSKPKVEMGRSRQDHGSGNGFLLK